MPCRSWDASALAKRYVPGKGTDTVDALFALPPTMAMRIRMHAAAKAERVAALNPEEVPPDKALAQLGDT